MNVTDSITNFIFVKTKLEKSDIIFIPGSNFDKLAYAAAALYNQKLASIILPSGKYSINLTSFNNSSSSKKHSTEFEFLKEILINNKVKESDILKEDQAQNTYENSLNSRIVCDKYNLNIKKAIIVCKSFHSRRCLMYYSLAFPNTEFYIYPIDYNNITRHNWNQTEIGINTVLGELERCGWQFKTILCNNIKNKAD